MKRLSLFAILLVYSLTVVNAKNEIINVGFTFSPSTLTIAPGENVTFTLEAMHNAVEVSKATWDANGATPLPGGFSVAFGGGEVLPPQLANGTHWYVCTPHASGGMKGIIIVGTPTGIEKTRGLIDISVFPNPANDLITVKGGKILPGTKYFVTDQFGRQVLTGMLDGETTSINISRFNKGIYYIQAEGVKSRSIKVIKN
jgi:plastocyanin